LKFQRSCGVRPTKFWSHLENRRVGSSGPFLFIINNLSGLIRRLAGTRVFPSLMFQSVTKFELSISAPKARQNPGFVRAGVAGGIFEVNFANDDQIFGYF